MRNKRMRYWRIAAAVLLLALPPFSAEAAEPYLVKDINAGANDSYPGDLTDVNGLLYFRAADETNGRELWRSNGTAAGTFMVKDIAAGADSSSPSNLTNVNGVLYFMANGTELWRSDGTEAGTVMVKDIYPDATRTSDYPSELTNVNGVLYFRATDGTNGKELWRSDGTAAGTFMVKDTGGAGGSIPHELTNVNGVLYFRADDGTNGTELWRSDGTAAGTVMVKDINAGAGNSFPSYSSYYINDMDPSLTNINGMLYFWANDGVNGTELWRSDGTEAGTFMVKDINAGADSSLPRNLTNVNGLLYFTATDGTNGMELWRSDGTEAGTFMVKDICAGAGNSFTSSLSHNLTNVNGVLYFTVDDRTHGDKLWRSDGTAAGTVMADDINLSLSSLINVNGLLYFVASDGTNDRALWRSDGTAAGTVMVKDIYVSSPPALTNVNRTLYFNATDGTNGYELWAYAPGFVVTPSAGTGGSISPDTPQLVDHGETTSFTVTPDEGYFIDTVTGCGGILDDFTLTYTTAAITADCAVTASFRQFDSDGDGIDDPWEEYFFGDLTTASASSDYDKDGYSDLQEFLNSIAGQTDPAGAPYDPTVKNAPGGAGYRSPMGWKAAVNLLLKQ